MRARASHPLSLQNVTPQSSLTRAKLNGPEKWCVALQVWLASVWLPARTASCATTNGRQWPLRPNFYQLIKSTISLFRLNVDPNSTFQSAAVLNWSWMLFLQLIVQLNNLYYFWVVTTTHITVNDDTAHKCFFFPDVSIFHWIFQLFSKLVACNH